MNTKKRLTFKQAMTKISFVIGEDVRNASELMEYVMDFSDPENVRIEDKVVSKVALALGEEFEDVSGMLDCLLDYEDPKHYVYYADDLSLSGTNPVVKAVCEFYGTSFQEIRATSRKRDIVLPRQVVMYFLKHHPAWKDYWGQISGKSLSLAKIGDLFGKDHATVLHAFRTINNLADTDRGFSTILDKLHGMISERVQERAVHTYEVEQQPV